MKNKESVFTPDTSDVKKNKFMNILIRIKKKLFHCKLNDEYTCMLFENHVTEMKKKHVLRLHNNIGQIKYVVHTT